MLASALGTRVISSSQWPECKSWAHGWESSPAHPGSASHVDAPWDSCGPRGGYYILGTQSEHIAITYHPRPGRLQSSDLWPQRDLALQPAQGQR